MKQNTYRNNEEDKKELKVKGAIYIVHRGVGIVILFESSIPTVIFDNQVEPRTLNKGIKQGILVFTSKTLRHKKCICFIFNLKTMPFVEKHS